MKDLLAHNVWPAQTASSPGSRIAIQAAHNGTVVKLLLKSVPDYRRTDDGGSFPKLWAGGVNEFLVQSHPGAAPLALRETRENYHFVQPLPGRRWLLVRGRSTGTEDANASVYDQTGAALYSFHLGDGIADVQTASDGRVWVSYFDEGVFAQPFGQSLGHSGLNCFDDKGSLLWRFTDPLGGTMADCYAVNVASDRETWLSYYTDFPLVRVKDQQVVSMWKDCPVRGSHAFAVFDQLALFAGGYEEKGKLFLVRLGIDEALLREEVRAVRDDAQALRFVWAIGRGSRLFLIDDRDQVSFIDLAGE